MIAKHHTYTFILTSHRLTLIYCPYFCIMITIRSVILKSILQQQHMIGKYVVLSIIISVVSDNI